MSLEDDIWHGTEASRRKAHCRIFVAGQDVTSKLDPHLISVEVIDKAGGGADQCAIELDDREGRLIIPPLGGQIIVELGWHTESFVVVFEGWVWDVESGFGRKTGGRRLWIEARGINTFDKGKAPFQMEWGEGAPPGQKEGKPVKFEEAIKAAAGKAGYSVVIDPALASIQRDYWSMPSESFFNLGQRLANEVGAIFKVTGGKAIFADALSMNNPQGGAFQNVVAEWGKNLIEWRIKPFAARPQWGEVASQFYDEKQGKWDSVEKALSGLQLGIRSKAQFGLPSAAPNKQVGEQVNRGSSGLTGAHTGTGWVIINGEPQARALMGCTIIGARAGVDGPYRIMEAHHRYSRRGYSTLLRLGLAPQGGSS